MKTKVIPEEAVPPITDEDRLEQDHREFEEILVDGPVVCAPIVLTVTRQYKHGGEKVEDDEVLADDTLEVLDFHVPPGEVDVRVGVTKNLGNYESVHVSVGLRVPCYREEAVEAFNHAREFVTKRVQDEITSAIEAAKTKGVKALF
jgi:hypothetical protein